MRYATYHRMDATDQHVRFQSERSSLPPWTELGTGTTIFAIPLSCPVDKMSSSVMPTPAPLSHRGCHGGCRGHRCIDIFHIRHVYYADIEKTSDSCRKNNETRAVHTAPARPLTLQCADDNIEFPRLPCSD